MPKLVLRKKAEIILEYLLNKDFLIIGSMEDCDICIPDKTVSLNHCQIKKEGDKYILYDLKGAYGTFVNGEKILSKELNFEDKIELGSHTLIFRSSDSKIDEKEQRYYFLGISGPFEGKKFELNNGETRIGRGEEYNDIVLPGEIDHSVSRRHSTIVRFENKFTLNDKRSRNRTFVNQYQVKEDDVVPLYLKDEILIGHSIFRFANEDCLDYSNPIKAGIFWIRFKTKISYVLLGLIFMLGISAFYYGFYGLLIVSNTPKVFSVKVSSWAPKINKDRLAYAFSPEYDLLPSPAVGEINRDKRSEVVVYNTSGVYAWDSQSGQLLWKMLLKKNEGALSASPVLADVNEDGCLDVVICSLDSRVYMINGLSGKLIYKSEILGGNINSSPVVADIDNDGLMDVVVASQEGVVYFIYAPVTTGKISSVRVGSELFSSPTVYQDKKRKFIAIGSSEGKIFFFNGREISDSFFMDTRDAINKLQGVHLPINEISSTPVVADLDGDGNLDIVVHSNQYYLAAVNISNRELNWVYQIEPPSEKPSPAHYSSPVLADLDNDNKPDVIVASCNGKIFAIKGTDGKLLWDFDTGRFNRIVGSPALADFNKDGVADAAFGVEDGTIYVLDGRTILPDGVERVLFKEKVSSFGIISSLLVGDLNGDGYLDLVCADRNNQLGIFNTNTRVFNGQLVWPMFQKDAEHSGSNLSKKTYQPYLSFLFGGVLLGVLVVVVQLLIRKNKLKKRPSVLKESKTAKNII